MPCTIEERIKISQTEMEKFGNYKEPSTFEQISDMIKKSLKSIPLHYWKHEMPTVLKLVQIVVATAGISAFAERTFSLARRLKTYQILNMGDIMSDALGVMAWYKDEVNTLVDLVKIGNEYIENCKDKSRSRNYGKKFTDDDFVTKNLP